MTSASLLMRHSLIAPAVAACAVLSLAAHPCAVGRSQSPADGPSRVAARAGTIVVSEGEVLREALNLRRDGRFESLVKTATVDGLDEVARAIVDRKLLAAEARQRGIDREPGVIDLMTRAADMVLVESLVTRVRDAADVSDGALRDCYDRQADRFRTGARRHARHIVVATEADLRAAQQALREGRPFADVATAVNTDVTKKTGGDLGWVTPGTMVREFEAALFRLDVGQISEPVRTGMGLHLVTVEAIDRGTLPAFELVKDKVVDAIKADAVATLLASLRQAHPISVDRTALDALLK